MIRLAFAAALTIIPQAAAPPTQRQIWNRPAAPFTVAGNIHYVGTEGLSAFLVTTPAGHVLIDGGSEESAALIAANVATLGYRMADVRTILINHAHWDHAGGLARLKAMAPRGADLERRRPGDARARAQHRSRRSRRVRAGQGGPHRS